LDAFDINFCWRVSHTTQLPAIKRPPETSRCRFYTGRNC
jgi:hypothetical protein